MKCVVSIWPLPERGGGGKRLAHGGKGLPGWFGALFFPRNKRGSKLLQKQKNGIYKMPPVYDKVVNHHLVPKANQPLFEQKKRWNELKVFFFLKVNESAH